MLKKRFFKTKDECELTFELEDRAATSAEIVSSATAWEPVVMKRVKAGLFRTAFRVPVGSRTEFRYRVDGVRWVDEPTADGMVANRFGSMNCVADARRPDGREG